MVRSASLGRQGNAWSQPRGRGHVSGGLVTIPATARSPAYSEVMARVIHRYSFPDRFVTGTIGDPDDRVFFVQARQGNRMTTVVCERQQVAVLGEHLEEVLDELARHQGRGVMIPPRHDQPHDTGPLDVPLDEDFRAGTMIIAWIARDSCLQVQLFAYGDYRQPLTLSAEDDPLSEKLEVVITPDQGRDFVARARQIVQSGLMSCPFCAQPLQPQGHLCPRSNGYRRQTCLPCG